MKLTDNWSNAQGAGLNGSSGNIRRYTKVCLTCGTANLEIDKFCNKCGNFVETAICPACKKPTNPMEAECINCHSNVAALAKADLDKIAEVLQVFSESGSFKELQPTDQMLRLARLDSLIGSACVFAFETVAKLDGSYKECFALFVYNEAPDSWDKPSSYSNPREKYSTKLEYLEALRKDSKRPDFGFFSWAITYARLGKDVNAYKLCMMLSYMYTTLGDLFDDALIISQSGVQFQQRAYELICATQKNPQIKYSSDNMAKSMFADVRYKVARQYFSIKFMGLADPEDDGSYTSLEKYYVHYNGGYKSVFDMIKNPLPEDKTRTKLLRGLMYYNFDYYQDFIDTWNAACQDNEYISSKKDYSDDCIFALSAIFMSSIYQSKRNMNAAVNTLRFAISNITMKHWAEVLMEEFSKYQQDSYGNIVYVE